MRLKCSQKRLIPIKMKVKIQITIGINLTLITFYLEDVFFIISRLKPSYSNNFKIESF